MDGNEEVNNSPTPAQYQIGRPKVPHLVADDLQGRVNALASALILQGFEPTLVRLRAGVGRTPQDALRKAFDHWKINVRPNIGKGSARTPTWGNEIPVPEAIKDLFCETWRKTLIAARMTQQFSDEALEKATVSEETRTIKACVDRLEGAIREHVEQRRVDADTLRTLTLRLAETCAASENAHSRLYEKLLDCRIAAETLQHRLFELGRDIEHTHVELHTLRRDLPLHFIRPPVPTQPLIHARRSARDRPTKKIRSRR